jgi:pantetheine-phosphate adenylyltransferase
MARALYPGTFDPFHNGHVDIALRASRLFDEVVVAIYDVPPKKLLFTTEERLRLAHAILDPVPNISLITYTGLTIQCARDHQVNAIVRGLRNVADFEYEQQIGWANSQLAPDIELCCLFCSNEYSYLSATVLKEVASLGGDCSRWAQDVVLDALGAKFNRTFPHRTSGIYHPHGDKLVHRD